MKKLRSVILLVAVLLMTTMSFSLLKVDGTYSVFAKQGGLGMGITFPVLPIVDTMIYIHMLGDADVTATGNIGGINFSGVAKMTATAIEMQAKLPMSFMDWNFGGTLLYDILSGSTAGQSTYLPGSLYAGLFGQYQQPITPLIAWYGQIGMLFKVLDGQKLINDQVSSGGSFDLSNIDRSGLYFRAGLSVGL